MSGLRRAVVAGITWQSLGALASQTCAVLFAITLARLLDPSDFGLVAMVSAVAGFASLLAQLGLGAALIQAPSPDAEQISSVFWLNLAAGLLLMLGFAALAPALAAFYREPTLVPLCVVLAAEFPLGALCAIPLALARRELRFRRIAGIELAATLAAGALAVALAANGFGVWSLAARSLAAATVRAAAYWPRAGFRPRLAFRWSAVRELASFGGNLVGTQTLRYWTRNLDSLLIGRFVGVEALGFYNAAYRLLLLPLSQGTRVMRRVLFPSLARIRGDRQRTRHAYLRALRGLSLVAFPLPLGLLAVLETAVPVLLGERWAPVVPIGRIFCAVGVLQALSGLNGSLYLSQGRADLQLRWGLLFRANAIAGIVIGLHWGPVGVATGYAVATALNTPWNTRIAARLVGVRLREVGANVAGPFACALAMSAGVWWLGRELVGVVGPAFVLALQLTAGALGYALLLATARPRAASEALGLLRDLRSASPGSESGVRAR